jgi:hypothetical protein
VVHDARIHETEFQLIQDTSRQQLGWILPDTVQSSAPDDGQKHRPKHVELTRNNKLTYIVVSCWLLSQFNITKFVHVPKLIPVSSELISQSLISYGKDICFNIPICVINVTFSFLKIQSTYSVYTKLVGCSLAASHCRHVWFGTLQLSYINICLVCRHAHNLLLNYAREAAVVH